MLTSFRGLIELGFIAGSGILLCLLTSLTVLPALLATFRLRDCSLSAKEIRVMLKMLEQVPTLPTIRLGLRLLLLTMVRKSELLFTVGMRSILRTPFGQSRRRA